MQVIQHIKPLTSIRAFAALWVVSMHYHEEFSALFPPFRYFQWFTRSGGMGVDVFFVLSGFILCYRHLKPEGGINGREYLHFIWLRVARVYPPYLGALLAVVAFVLIARVFHLHTSDAHYPPGVLIPELAMVHMWSWQNYQLGWNAVDWSVSAEWFAYLLVFPIACFSLKWVKATGWQILAIILLLLALLLPWPLNQGDWKPMPPPCGQVTLEFLVGAILFSLRRQIGLLSAWLINLFLCGSMALSALLLANPQPTGPLFRPLLVACFGLAIFALSHESGIFFKWLSIRPFVYLGEISYSIYLTHQIVQRVLKNILHPDRFHQLSAPVALLFLAIYGVAILAIASLLYHLVEDPCRRYLRKVYPFGKSPGPVPGLANTAE